MPWKCLWGPWAIKVRFLDSASESFTSCVRTVRPEARAARIDETEVIWRNARIIRGVNAHREKSCRLLSAGIFSVISPAKFGRLGPFYFCEVSTWLLEVRFWALLVAFSHFPSLSALLKRSKPLLMARNSIFCLRPIASTRTNGGMQV